MSLHVTQVDTHAQPEREGSLDGVVLSDSLLQVDRALEGISSVGELEEKPITNRLDFPASASRDDRVYDGILALEKLQCGPFIFVGVGGESFEIREEYRREMTPLGHARSFGGGRLATRHP